MCSSEDIFFVDQGPSAIVVYNPLEFSAFQLSSGDISYNSMNSVVWSSDDKQGRLGIYFKNFSKMF
jgi:hypothetical protein